MLPTNEKAAVPGQDEAVARENVIPETLPDSQNSAGASLPASVAVDMPLGPPCKRASPSPEPHPVIHGGPVFKPYLSSDTIKTAFGAMLVLWAMCWLYMGA